MRVSIWDLDFYHKKKGINYECMKIASFHKQRGDKINFITEKIHIDMAYDLMYITKIDENLSNPPLRYLNNPKVKVWGMGFRYFTNYQLPPIILAVRPDYLLYPDKEDKFDRADALQFFDYKGRPLPLVQDPENTFKNKKSLIIDKFFWSAEREDLVKVMKDLQDYKSLAFLEPISLKRLLNDRELQELFLSLHFTKDTRFQWKNNFGQTYEAAVKIIDFLDKLAQKTHSAVGAPPFVPITGQHLLTTDNAWADLIRCLKIIAYGKQKGIAVKIDAVESRHDTPYIHLFYTLYSWTTKSPKMALLRFIALPLARQHKASVEEVYMRREWWSNEIFVAWMDLLRQKAHDSEFIMWLLIEWKNKSMSIADIDWTEVSKLQL